MKVTVAKNAGFCFGVERAVNRAYEEEQTCFSCKLLRPAG